MRAAPTRPRSKLGGDSTRACDFGACGPSAGEATRLTCRLQAIGKRRDERILFQPRARSVPQLPTRLKPAGDDHMRAAKIIVLLGTILAACGDDDEPETAYPYDPGETRVIGGTDADGDPFDNPDPGVATSPGGAAPVGVFDGSC